jgi:hypothetical protein
MTKSKSLTCLIFFIAFYSNAQQNCDTYIKENNKLKASVKTLTQEKDFLNQKLELFNILNSAKDYTVKPFSDDINVQIISCRGDKAQQTVKLEIILSHNLPHQEMCVNIGEKDASAVDELGNTFAAKEGIIGMKSTTYGYICTNVPTDVPTKSNVTFRNILPGTDKLKFITVKYGYRNADGGMEWKIGFLEIRNISIKW